MRAIRKPEGFRGQEVYYVPEALRQEARQNPLGIGLHVLHIGWFPAADGHFIQRESGLDEWLLMVCSAGSGWLRIGGPDKRIACGDVVVIPPGCPHAYGADREHPWSIHWAHFNGTAAAAYGALMDDFRTFVDDPALDEIDRVFRHALAALTDGSHLRTVLYASHALRHILGLIFFRAPALESVGGRGQTGAGLTEVIQFLRANLDRRLALKEIAARSGLSPSRFANIFQRHTGVSPVAYHIRLRMQAACELLDTTSLNVQQIAHRLGYEDPYYFSRTFRKIMGHSPSDHRRLDKG